MGDEGEGLKTLKPHLSLGGGLVGLRRRIEDAGGREEEGGAVS